VDELDKVIICHVEELFEFDATVGEGAERSLLFELGGESGVGNICVSLCSRSAIQFVRSGIAKKKKKREKTVSDLGFKIDAS